MWVFSAQASLPAWERGLKLDVFRNNGDIYCASLPAWERGLKLMVALTAQRLKGRSPRGSVD